MEVDSQFIDIETVIPYTPFLKRGFLSKPFWKVLPAHQGREFLD
jgi:hypothetical protein